MKKGLGMYSFEKFTNQIGRNTLKISIRSCGQIGFSQAIVKDFGIGTTYNKLVLFYDSQLEVIGMKPLKEDEEDEASISINYREVKRSKTASIYVKGFFEFHNISYVRTRSFPCRWLDEEDMLIAEIGN